MPPLNTSSGPRTAPPANARELQRATAEKIDKIESEMSLDFSGRPNSQPMAQRQSAPAPAPVAPPPRPVAQRPPPQRPPVPLPSESSPKRRAPRSDGTTSTLPSLGQTTDILLGDSILANAMELTDSASSPAIEEAAILYANGQALPALSVLSEATRSEGAGGPNMQAWLMLFELYQALGKKGDFENLAFDYAVRFETSSPTWSDDSADQPAAPVAPIASAPTRAQVLFKGILGGNIVPQLDQLKRLAQKNAVLFLDFSAVNGSDATGSDLILRVFAAFQKSNHEVIVLGAENLADRLLANIEVGRRDPSNAVWMLLLEIYRILGRQAAFEETSIDYCVTYEVSPPSWEAPSPKLKVGESNMTATEVIAPLAIDMESTEAVFLSGDLLGKAEAELGKLNTFAADHRRISVNCRRLRRVDFTAAGVLLNWAVGAQGANKTVEFKEVSNLVAALFVVMGLHEVAQIERRKF